MGNFLIYLIILVALFAPAFITKRRFGLLGLALAAGSILSQAWGYDLGLVAGIFRIPTGTFSSAIISAATILLPAVILLFHGYAYKTLIGRLIGASLFTLLAFTFLTEPLSHIFTPVGFGSNVYEWIIDNHNFIIGVGLIVSVIDLFFTKPVGLSERHNKKSKH